MYDTKELQMGPPRHEKLPPNLISRVRLIRAALLGVYTHSMEFWVDGFRGEPYPTDEIVVWEHLAACFVEYCSMTRLTQKQRKQVFAILLAASCGNSIVEIKDKFKNPPHFSIEKLDLLWNHPWPLIDVADSAFPQSYEITSEAEERLRQEDPDIFLHEIPDDLIRKLIVPKPSVKA